MARRKDQVSEQQAEEAPVEQPPEQPAGEFRAVSPQALAVAGRRAKQEDIRRLREEQDNLLRDQAQAREEQLDAQREASLPENRLRAYRERQQSPAPAGETPQEPPPPPTEGTLPPEYANVPVHPVRPDRSGSAPHTETMPAGPMDEDVVYVTDDIAPDGTPLIQPDFVEARPEIDGESDRLYTDVDKGWQHSPAEPVGRNAAGELEPMVNQHSPEGARLDELKTLRPVEYVPTEATLDPVSGQARVD